MSINTNTLGRILSVQKILVNGIERTPEGAESDGKVAPYMLIRGSTGNDAIVDSNGNLVCMLKGSENLPIAQDASGNMVAVMKGDYDGALVTWKVDDEGRGEMFVHHVIDFTGVEAITGIATSVESDAVVLNKTVRRIRVIANGYDMYLRTSHDGTTWEDQIHIKADVEQWFDIECHSFKVQRYGMNDVDYEVEGYI